MHGRRVVPVCVSMICWGGLATCSSSVPAQGVLESEDVLSTSDDSLLPDWGGACRRNHRKTLLQWSYGTSFGGGSHLNEPLVTDRPDFTEASSTVGRGVAQLEFGYTYFHDTADGESTTVHSIGEPLLRYGLGFDWLEFRIAANSSGRGLRSDFEPCGTGRRRNLPALV